MTTGLASEFLLDPDVTFLNHGSYGACPRVVFEAYQAWLRELERQPVAFLDRFGALKDRLGAVRQVLAAEMGANKSDIALFTNSTSALNVVLQSLDLRPGDEILTSDHEYAAMDKCLEFICKRAGARVVRANVPMPLRDATAFTNAFLDKISAHTRLLFLSHITSATALKFPIESVLTEARARGIITVIDAAHAPGQVDLDLQALGADFYAGNCHKWMMAPKGSAFLYARADVQHLLKPSIISHGWTGLTGEIGPFGNPAFIDALEMQGTRDPAAWLAVPEAIAFATARNWSEVRTKCQSLVQDTAARIRDITHFPALSTPEFCAPQMIACEIATCDPRELHQRLLAEFKIEIPCHTWHDKTLIRVSVQGYTTQAELDHLVSTLRQLFA
ncbi:MAG: aminotransferase class V-fold PLP-dependent enzyme [Deltaproteobacteria bacterium]